MSDKSLAEILQQAIRAILLDVHVCLPAKIESYDASKQQAKISLLLKKKYKTGEISDLPIVNNVPVQFPSAGGAFIHMPLKNGNTGIAIFCERSIDRWLSGDGKSVNPLDTRHHDLSDAVFIPGVNPFSQAFTVSNPDSITIKNESSEVEVSTSGINILGGTINLGNGAEKAVLGDTLASLYLAHTHSGVQTGGGVTGPPSNNLNSALSAKVNLE